MIYLTSAQVLFIHARLATETGGGQGIRDEGLLAAAIARPQATFDGHDLYPRVYDKAAALMASIVLNHPFVDGNKRVGITSAGLFLRLNGYRLTVGNPELEEFTLRVAQGEVTLESMANWFERHTHTTPPPS